MADPGQVELGAGKDSTNQNLPRSETRKEEKLCCFVFTKEDHSSSILILHFVFLISVVLTTILSIISAFNTRWAETDFDMPVGEHNITHIQFGPFFHALKNTDPLFSDENYGMSINFVDSSQKANAFNSVRFFVVSTVCTSVVFLVSFFNKRAFYEYRRIVLGVQICLALSTILAWEIVGKTDENVDSRRDYVWATYEGGDANKTSTGYVLFILSNIIFPIFYWIALSGLIRRSNKDFEEAAELEEEAWQRVLTCRTGLRELFHSFFVLFFTILYLYSAYSSKWAVKDFTVDEYVYAASVTSTSSTQYLLNGNSESWGSPDRIEQGPYSECIIFNNFDFCRGEVSGTRDRVELLSSLRWFVTFGCTSVICNCLLSLTSMFEDFGFLDAFANIILPLATLIFSFVSIIIWGVAGSEDYLTTPTTSDAIWAKGKLAVSYYLFIICTIFNAGLCVYYWYFRDYTYDAHYRKGSDDEEEEDDDDIDDKMAELPPDPYWTMIGEDAMEGLDSHYHFDIHDPKYMLMIILSFLSFGLVVFSGAREWSNVQIHHTIADTEVVETVEISTLLFGQQCLKYTDFVGCSDFFSFAGTRTRLVRMQCIFSFYFLTTLFLMWGTYEHIRNKMHPRRRLGWFAITFIFALIPLGVFFDNKGSVEWSTIEDRVFLATPDKFSTIYSGLDITYIEDITNVPETFSVEIEGKSSIFWYSVGVAVLALSIALQIYLFYIFDWEANRVHQDHSKRQPETRESDGV